MTVETQYKIYLRFYKTLCPFDIVHSFLWCYLPTLPHLNLWAVASELSQMTYTFNLFSEGLLYAFAITETWLFLSDIPSCKILLIIFHSTSLLPLGLKMESLFSLLLPDYSPSLLPRSALLIVIVNWSPNHNCSLLNFNFCFTTMISNSPDITLGDFSCNIDAIFNNMTNKLPFFQCIVKREELRILNTFF